MMSISMYFLLTGLLLPTLPGPGTTSLPPLIDLSADTSRQVVVAQGTPQLYNGQPTTALMPDGKTIHCVWTYGHGGKCGPAKISGDGGRTWANQPIPSNWITAVNCPAIYLLPAPDGQLNLITFAGSGPDKNMQQAIFSGTSWSPMRSNGVGPVGMPFCTIIPVDGGKKLLGMTNRRRPGEKVEKKSCILAQSISADGGLTWGPLRTVLDTAGLKPCEPEIIRSPKGDQLLCLIRENEKKISLYMTSADEGQTWSSAQPLPEALWGDRHKAKYDKDGRLVIVFRDTGPHSPTKNSYVAWVGKYEDILQGNPGQYRLKLLHSYKTWDCGYSGLELLPDRTFVATTYIKYRPGENKNSIVCTRFSLTETDQLMADRPQQ
ncbi:sialidase family protein [Chitinophaga cymbidii]|nr:sialidase family protein [Chitinophaga cymbidii]